jgi:hypothetical protein
MLPDLARLRSEITRAILLGSSFLASVDVIKQGCLTAVHVAFAASKLLVIFSTQQPAHSEALLACPGGSPWCMHVCHGRGDAHRMQVALLMIMTAWHTRTVQLHFHVLCKY